jgi:H+-transporting ATPase
LITVKSFIPFDPTSKRTEVIYQDKSDSKVHRVSKGMPDAILRLCKTTEHADKIRGDVKEFANRGLRGLAVAIADGDENFKLIGLLPILDPPRDDTAETIKRALELGVQVKMITGDQLEIAKETGRRLGMGVTMYVYEDLLREHGKSSKSEDEINSIVLKADGFASVFPEHKFEIVKRLQDMGHLVAMTGKVYFPVLFIIFILLKKVMESMMLQHYLKQMWVLLFQMQVMPLVLLLL